MGLKYCQANKSLFYISYLFGKLPKKEQKSLKGKKNHEKLRNKTFFNRPQEYENIY